MQAGGPNAHLNATLAMAATPCRASEAQLQQFTRGLAAVMNQWTALHLVANHIDPSAFQNLYQDLVEWHTRDGEIYSDEMELFFEDFFGLARSVVIEDDSMKEVADILHDMYCRCTRDDFSRVEHFVNTEAIFRRENPVALCVNGGGGGGGDDEEELGGLTMAEAAAASAGEDDDGQKSDSNEEEQALPPQGQQNQMPKNRKKKKNASRKGNDGWSVVL